MIVEELLVRLDGVRRTSHGHMARCPAHHPDRHPSLSIWEGEDGRLLLHCFAGCSVEETCKAIGLRVADLFPEGRGEGHKPTRRRPKSPRFDWEATAFQFRFHADGLWLRAQAALHDLVGLNVSQWADDDRAAAMEVVGRAYADLSRAELLDAVAFGIRQRGLEKERKRYASRQSAA